MSAPAPDPAAAPPAQSAKNALRREVLARRRLTVPDPEASARLCAALLATPEVAAARVAAGYVALPGEPDIGAALEALRARGVRVVLPVMTDTRDLDFRADDGGLVPASEIDVVLAPAVAADRAGHRLGRGGGSYDRCLPRVRPDALVIAVVHADELVEEVPVEAHDRVVDAVLAGDSLHRVAP
jgi:5-formyltetrahydrofolate cyclo-ligase